jgi:predicted O-methyltransferase YrrM
MLNFCRERLVRRRDPSGVASLRAMDGALKKLASRAVRQLDVVSHLLRSSEPAPPSGVLGRSELACFPMLRRIEDHPKAWTFPTYLNPSESWVATLRDLYASPIAFPASLSPAMGMFLHSLVRNVRPRTVVEIGTFLGVSTIWTASALEAAKDDPPQLSTAPGQLHGAIHCFDDFAPIQPGAWRAVGTEGPRDALVRRHLQQAGLAHRVTLHPGDSSECVARARDAGVFGQPGSLGGGIDLAFIDGDHSAPGALRDLRAVEPSLNTGGYIVLHDTFPEQCGDHMGPRTIIDRTREVATGRYELCEIYTAPLNYGMAVLRRIG